MSRFLRLCALLSVFLFSSNAFAAYGTCSVKYTACAAGYYLSGTSAGNSCKACPSGWTTVSNNTSTSSSSCYKQVSLNKNGGSGTLTTNVSTYYGTTNGYIKCYYGSTCSIPTGLTKSGYTQSGWGTSSSCTNTTNAFTYSSVPSTAYACWQSSAKSCSAGTYWNGSSCASCTAGYSCPGFSNVSAGNLYDGYGRYECDEGTYSTGGASSCSTLQAGYWNTGCGTNNTGGVCNTEYFSGGACEDGYYCPAGSTSPQQKECATIAGSSYTKSDNGRDSVNDCYKTCTKACTRQTCPANATCTHGTTSTSGKEYYGGTCNAAASTCSLSFTCNPGHYLSNGECVACGGSGYYCPGDNSRHQVSSGYYSTGGSGTTTRTGQTKCEAGNYCSGGVKYACGGGKWSNAGATSCSSISAGCYGTSASSACPNSCSKGTYSTGGATSCSNVDKGCYADTTGSTSSCPKSCPAGTYGSTTGLTSSACSGSCSAGYYCPAKSTSATQNKCPAGSYCPAGSGSAIPCGGGKWSSAGATSCSSISAGCYGTSATTACPNSCSKGTYSTGGATSCSNVDKGCYADTTGSTSSCPKSCPAGTYGSVTGLTSSACSGSCSAGYYCPAKSTSATQNKCPAGSFCVAGAAEPTACATGSYTNTTAQSTCIACGAGKTTSGTGKTSCDATCANASNVKTWATPSWSANTVTNLCTVSTCNSKYVRTGSSSTGYACSSCTCTKGANVNSCTVTGTNSSNQCQYSYSCYEGYNGTGSFNGTAGVASNTSPACGANVCALTYNCGDDDPIENTFSVATTVEAVADICAAKQGYHFRPHDTEGVVAFVDGEGVIYFEDDSLTCEPDGDYYLYAYYDPNAYKVHFYPNKPSSASTTMTGSMTDQWFTYDVAKNLSANQYSLPGYQFVGWNTQANGSGASYEDAESVKNLTDLNNGTVYLYAQWEVNTINLKWVNGGRGTAPTTPASCTYDGTFKMPAAMTATGYLFDKWSVNGNTFAASKTNVPTNVACTHANLGVYSGTATISGTWTPNKYTIVLDRNNIGSNDVSTGTTMLYTIYDTSVFNDSDRTKVMAPFANGITKPVKKFTVTYNAGMGSVSTTSAIATSTFNGYYSTESDNNGRGAQYIGSGGMITQAGVDAGIKVAGLTIWHAQWTGGTVTLPTPTRSGYTFNGWYTAASGGTRVGGAGGTYTPTSNVALYAQWSKGTVTVDWNENGGAGINNTVCSYGEDLTLPSAPTRANHQFIGWTLKNGILYSAGTVIPGGCVYEVVGDSGTSIKAQWRSTTGGYTCTVQNKYTSCESGYLSDCGTSGWQANQTATGTWGNSCVTTCPTGYSCAGGATCPAPNTYTISFDANGGTGGQSADVTATYDATMPGISTTKPTKVGCKFNGWYDATSGGTQYYTAAGASARIWNKTANTTLFAQWSCMSVTGPSNQSKVYDGTALTCNGGISVSAPSGATVTYATQSGGTCGTYGSAPTRTTAGTTTVCYKITATDYTAKTGTFTCSVTQANGSTTIKDGSTDVTNKSGSTAYPGTKSLTITCAGGATSNITATSGTASVATTSVSGTSVTLTSKATGSSRITVNCPATTNYKASSATYDWTVSNGTISVSKSDKSKTYNGSALTCNGLTVNSPSGTTVEYSTDGGSTWSTTVPSRTNAGTTTVNYRVSKTNYTTVTGSFSCKVNKAAGTTTIDAGASSSTAFPGTKVLNITCSEGATISSATSGTTAVATVATSGNKVTLTPVKTGSSVITVNCPATTNYNASSATHTWTVTNGTITATVTNPNKTYNGSALSCAGISNVVPSGATVSYAEKSGTTCGTYSSTVPSRTNAGTTNVCYKIEATNYTTKSGEFSCEVYQADNTLTLSATSGSMPYSSTATFTVSTNTSGGTLSVESGNENCATATISGTTVTISSKANYCTANITVTSAATTNYKTKSATYALIVNKGTITLNNRSATSAGTTAIYQTYNTNVYLDNARSKVMTTSANAITVPSRTGYTFGGYYSASDGTGTQYINASGNITSDGLTAGKALQANGTWYAKWTANSYTCAAGEYLNITACTTCTAGHYCPSTQKTYTYNGGIQGRTACAAGTYQPDTGKTSCDKAKMGYYVPSEGAVEQLPCTGTTYADEMGLTECKVCPTVTNNTANATTSYDYWNTGEVGDHTTVKGCNVKFTNVDATHGSMSELRCYADEEAATSGEYGVDGTSKGCWVYWNKLTCDGGYYNANYSENSDYDFTNKTLSALKQNACVDVTSGYWSRDGDLTREGCPGDYSSGSDSGRDSEQSCYANITLNKNGFSGKLVSGTGCPVSGTNGTINDTLKLYYNTACTLPTTSLTQTGYTATTGWAASNTLGATAVTTIAASTSAPSVKTYYARKTTCAANYYKSANTTCSACSGLTTGGFYSKSSAGTASDSSVCFGTLTKGTYVAEAKKDPVSCEGGYCDSTADIYYGQTGGRSTLANWTCPGGADAASDCYRGVTLNKNGMSGALALPADSGCRSIGGTTGANNDTVYVYYNKACKLPTTALSATATGTTYTGTKTWATSANAASGFVSSITLTDTSSTTPVRYAGKMYTCSGGYYLKANTNGACTACSSPYYCEGITNKYYSANDQGRSACADLDSAKKDGTYTSVSPYNDATTCRFTQEQQPVTAYCATKTSNTMSYNSNGWPANTYKVTALPGSIIVNNNKASAACSQCTGATYSAGGTAITCSDCDSNYTYNTDAGKSLATQCQTSCDPGKAVLEETKACAVVTGSNYKVGTAPVNYGSKSPTATDITTGWAAGTIYSCPSSYSISGTAASDHDERRDCTITCDGGTQVATANAVCTTPTGSWYTASHPVSAGSTSGTNVKSCDSDYATANTTTKTDHDNIKDCKVTCEPGTQVATANAACTTPNTANWYTAQHVVSQTETSSTNVKSCNTGYSIAASATAANHDGADDCKISCSAGYYVPNAGQGCKVCTAGKYCNAASGIAQTTTTSVTGDVNAGYWNNGCGTNATGSVCSTSYKGGAVDDACYGAKGATSSCPSKCEDLTPAVAVTGGDYSSVTPRSAATQCRYTAPAKTANGCSTVTANTVSYSGTAWGSGYYTAKADQGYRVSATNTATPACAICACGTYQGTIDSTATSCTKTDAGYYAGEGAATQTKTNAGFYAVAGACTQTPIDPGCFGGAGSSTACPNQCPVAESGWTLTGTTGLTQVTECTETTTPAISGSPIATICTAGTLTKKATSATAWGTATASGLKAKSGRYVKGLTCEACNAGTYQSTNGSTTTSCTPAAAGYFVSAKESASQTPCPAGTYQGSTGKTSCSNATAGTYTTGCKITSNNTACTGTSVCATNTYSNDKASTCTACATDKGYGNSGDNASYHAGVKSCKVTCAAGQYVASENAACTDVTSGYYRSGTETVSQGDTGTRKQCSALGAFYTASDSGRDADTDCYGTTAATKFIKTAKDATETLCGAGSYCAGGAKVYYNATGGSEPCTAGSFCAAGVSEPTACVTGSYTNATGQSTCTPCQDGKTTSAPGQTSCNATCANNNSYDVDWENASWSANSMTNLCVISKCGAGSKYASANGGSCTACGLGTYQSSTSHTNTTCSPAGSGYYVATEGASSQSACTAWRANTNTNGATGSTSTSACVCKSGMYLNSSNACEACAAGTYKSANSNAACTPAAQNSFVDGTGQTSQKACSTLGSFYTKTKSTGSTSGMCYGTTAAGKYIKTAKSSTQETCAAGSYCPETEVFYGGYDTTGGRKQCPGGYTDGGMGLSAENQCAIACAPGTRVASQNALCTTPSGNWYTGGHEVTYGLTSGDSVNACAVATNLFNPGAYNSFNGYFNATGNKVTAYAKNAFVYLSVEPNTQYLISGKTGPSALRVASLAVKPAAGAAVTNIVDAAAAESGLLYTTSADAKYIAIMVVRDADGTSTSAETTNKVKANVATMQVFAANAGYGIIGNAASNHDAASDCQITCGAGQYLPQVNATCANVEAGYYGAGGTVGFGSPLGRGVCPTGMTTIGYGLGANERGDCGRVLNAGDSKIYLRSEKRTTPSLNARIGDQVFYGNMSETIAGALKVKINSTGKIYSVVNDNQ